MQWHVLRKNVWNSVRLNLVKKVMGLICLSLVCMSKAANMKHRVTTTTKIITGFLERFLLETVLIGERSEKAIIKGVKTVTPAW